MTVQELITASMRKLGVVASGETPTPNELADGLMALQGMLRFWAARKIVIFASVKESFSLVGGTSSYTWGSGGTITTARPNQVIGAFIRDGANVDHSVDVISEGVYRRISVKTTSSRPYALFYHPTYPTGNLYLYPTPADAETMHLESFKPFTETSSFDAQASTLAFPLNYEEPMIYNLARRLASEYGKKLADDDLKLAEDGFSVLMSLNAANQIEPSRIEIPASWYSRRYSINSDTYR